MNREDAKLILQACRSHSDGGNDPAFQAALELLKSDPQLAAWFVEQQETDRRLAEKFGTFPVPADLQARLLAAPQIHAPAVPWWRGPRWLPLAASLALVGVLLIWFVARPPAPLQFSEFRSFIGSIASDRQAQLEFTGRDLPALRTWLNSRSAPDEFTIPAGLVGRPTLGCRVIDWNERRVSFVCFELENRAMVHLFVIDRAQLRGLPDPGARETSTHDPDVNLVSWADAKSIYVLAGHQSAADLLRLL